MKRPAILLSCLGLLVLMTAARSSSAADFQVVVHSANPVESLSSGELGQLFLKKNTRWEGGAATEPIDQADGAVRNAFSERVHGKSVGAIKSYWQRQIFSGRATPPPELSSDSEVLAFVRSHPWAIGYVSAGVSAGNGVKVVRLSH